MEIEPTMSVSKPTSENNHPSSSTKIRVIAIRRFNRGTVRAIADIGLVTSVVLKGFKVVQQPGQRAWASPPSRECQGTDGKRRFTSRIELTGFLKSQVEQAILEAHVRSEGGQAHG
jgi:DNA-binding cell septation regulator SpoVG